MASDFFDVFGPGATTSDFGVGGRLGPMEEEEDYERTWFERAFAPFEAPQQGLFSLTTGIAEDGFQASDILDSMSHAARFFNPWSNVKPIEADEVRQVFFGEGDDLPRLAKFGSNLAISLLYDPLLFAGAAKAVGAVADGTRGLRALQAVTNPAEEVIRQGLKLSNQVVRPRAMAALRKSFGAERIDNLGTQIMQYTVNRYAGLPDELVRRVQRVDQDVAKWRTRAFDIFKRTERMGGKQGQDLLAEAMETEAFYLMRKGETLTEGGLETVNRLTRKREELGISEDLFLQAYDDMRLLDDEIGRGLYKKGLIDRDTMRMYEGTHLRRIYRAYEQPEQYIDSITKLIADRPDLAEDVTYLSRNAVRDSIRGMSPMQAVTPQPQGFLGMSQVADTAANRYIRMGEGGKLDAHRFSNDLWDWLGSNSNASADEVLDHIGREMLPGVDMGAGFRANVMTALTNGKRTQRGGKFYQSKLRDLISGHGTGWRAFQERTEIVSKRERIRPELADILGEVTEAAPRMAAQASDAGRLLEMRTFFDDVAGIRRIDDETGDLIQKARRAIESGDDVAPEIAQEISERVGRELSPTEMVSLDTGSEILDEAGGRVFGSGLVSPEQSAKHSYHIPDNPTFGVLADTWTTPATGMMIRRLEGVGDIHNPTNKLAVQALEALRRGTGHFKMFKVIMDPTAQVRNFVGNSVLMEMQGTTVFRVDRMIKSGQEVMNFIKHGKMGQYLQLADDAGLSLFQSTFSKNELAEIAQRLTRTPSVNRSNWERVYEGLYGAFQRSYRNTSEFAAKSFEFNEMLFKLNVFSDKYDDIIRPLVKKGKTLTPEVRRSAAIQAGALAEQALFNYADVPYLVDFARKYGIVPFATFPFKAIPYVADTLYKNPHRVLRYERAVGEYNDSFFSGSPDERAREIAALPQHMRESMVAKLPFSDSEGRPLYMDLSYFMPWYTIKDMTESFQTEGPFDPGMRSGIMTPPAMALVDAFRRGEDSLGRPIFDPSASTTENFAKGAEFLMEFIAPPSLPGVGSRADSIGRALQAYARSDPEVQDWVGIVGTGLRGTPDTSDTFTGAGRIGQTQAQVGVGGTAGALGGILSGILFGGASASDPAQARQNAMGQFGGTATEIAREIAQVRSNRGLSPTQKRERIARLRAQMIEAREERARTLSDLR